METNTKRLNRLGKCAFSAQVDCTEDCVSYGIFAGKPSCYRGHFWINVKVENEPDGS
jgi:hypothetical protein